MAVRRFSWWEARTAREKQLVLAAAVLLALLMVWVAIVRPIADARAAAEQRLNLAVAELAKARADAAALRQARPAGGAPVPLPLDGFLMTAGSEAGLTNLVVIGDGPARATATVPNVRPQAFFGWLTQLEARGIIVESLSARPNSDQTIAVEAILRARSG